MFRIEAAILLVVLVIYAIWRFRKVAEAQQKFAPLMPPSNHLSWKRPKKQIQIETVQIVKNTQSVETLSGPSPDSMMTIGLSGPNGVAIPGFLKEANLWGAGADGAIAGSFLAEAALNVDPHVLAAIQFSTADHLHGLADIDNYVHDHFFAVPVHSADGWFERLTGYVAEQKAAAYFEQAGHHVEFAPVANQPVWDMLVDGQPVQIKEGLAGAKDFLVHHPGVDIYTGSEIATAIKDPAVHGLDLLNKDAIHAATENSIDNVNAAINPDLHFPLITLAFSSWREARLLWNEKTTFDRALKHVGMDVIGVGGGAWLGGSVGAAVGGPFAPVTGFLGAILGALGGKMLSTKIRFARFYSAREQYNNAISSAQAAINFEIDRSKRFVLELREQYQGHFLDARSDIERTAKEKISKLGNAFDQELLMFCERFPDFLNDLIQQIDDEEQQVLSQIPSPGVWDVLFPSEQDLYRGVIRSWFKRARESVRAEIVAYGKIELRTVETLHAEVQRFLRAFTFELNSMADDLSRLTTSYESSRVAAENIRDQAVTNTEAVRTRLITDFGKKIVSMQENILNEVRRWNGIVQSNRSVLKKEAASVDVKL